MQEQTQATAWHSIRNQIGHMAAFERQIENLRGLLAEDWQLRLAHQNSRQVDEADRFEFAGNPGFSAC